MDAQILQVGLKDNGDWAVMILEGRGELNPLASEMGLLHTACCNRRRFTKHKHYLK